MKLSSADNATDSTAIPWDGIYIDDGGGKNAYFLSKNGKKSRNAPDNYIPEYLPTGARRYYFKGVCIRCRNTCSPCFLTANGGKIGFSLNYCSGCLIKTTPSIPTDAGLRRQGEAVWQVHEDTPMHAYINLYDAAMRPDREEEHLMRSRDASFAVMTSAKQRRNSDRYRQMKAIAYRYEVLGSKMLSWGFGVAFDEYIGDVAVFDGKELPHGRGIKVYSDESVYVGDWVKGVRTCSTAALWLRPDGTQYEGTFLNDMKHGHGYQRYPDGSEYNGEFAMGYEHGQGRRVYSDKSVFDGRFRFGKKDGLGVLTMRDGTVLRQVFKDNVVFHEQAVPEIVEVEEEADMSLYFQPDSLLKICIESVANAMHRRRDLLSSEPIHSYLQNFLKPRLVTEFLRTIHPKGSKEFEAQAPQISFHDKQQVRVVDGKFKNLDAECLFYFIAANKGLERLELSNNRLDPQALDLFARALFDGTWPNLKLLDFSFNRIDTSALEHLLSALQGVPRLEVLKLSGCQITSHGCISLASYLKTNHQLKELNLSFNAIQAAGADFLAEALIENRSLTSLDLRLNGITAVGGDALVNALRHNATLCRLCIADNKIGADVATAIAARLRGKIHDVTESFCASELRIPARHLERNAKH